MAAQPDRPRGNESFRVLDDFICEAIPSPGVPQGNFPGKGINAGMQVLSEFVDVDRNAHRSLTVEQRTRLESMSRVGKMVVFKNKAGGGYRTMGTVEDEVYIMVSDYKHVIQKIRFADGVAWDGSTHAYRTGYYTYDAAKKRIVWGQYTQFLTEKEYKALLTQARSKGWDVI